MMQGQINYYLSQNTKLTKGENPLVIPHCVLCPCFRAVRGGAIPSQTAVKERYDDSRSDKDKTNGAGTVKV